METVKPQKPQSNGFTFVTVAPKGNVSDNPTIRRLRAIQDVEKATYRGADVTYIGRPGNGINQPRVPPPALAELEKKCAEALEELSPDVDLRPLLISFSAVNENELVREGPPENIYAKGNFLNHKDLLYRTFKADARLVRSVLEATGFHYTDSHDWNMMWLGTSAEQYLYEGLNPFEKVNHFPNSFEITRKDKMTINLMNMEERFGKEAFDFMPETFVLPDDFAELYECFNEEKKSKWIVKPSCSSQGRGIYIVDTINEVPMDENIIISRYIQNPLLINGLKFDLRIYVLITCFDPLKIYVYDEGLARFASEPYNPNSKKNKFSHLTNYSINKKSDKFVENMDAKQDDIGHKWSLSALFKYLDSAGVDVGYIWNKIYDLIIKTVLSIENIVVESVRRIALHRNNCFDLFGFDVLIDSNLKPWLLEVNLSPSLATESPLDLFIKGHLVADTFNLVGIRLYDRKRENMNKARARLRARQNEINHAKDRSSGYLSTKSAQRRERDTSHTAKFRETLKEALEEYERKGNFFRIYPAQGTDYYDQYFPTIRSNNKGLYRALFVDILGKDLNPAPPPLPVVENRPQTSTTPEKPPSPPKAKESSPNASIEEEKEPEEPKRRCIHCQGPNPEGLVCSNCKNKTSGKEGKLVITGDDILMEYICRLMHAIKAIREESLKPYWKTSIDKFVCHYVWHGADSPSSSLWERLDARVNEMKERQRRLLSNVERGKINKRSLDEEKEVVIRGFSASELEGMLYNSTKNIAEELVSCLINSEGRGVLTDIIKWLASTAANNSKPMHEIGQTKIQEESSLKKVVAEKRPYTSGKYED